MHELSFGTWLIHISSVIEWIVAIFVIRKISTYNPLSNYNQAIKQLINNGIRPTKQRMILAKLLFEKGDRHVSAEDLYEEVKKDNRKIALATIYNSMFTHI